MKKIGFILITIGILIILIPVAGNIYNDYRQEKLLEEFREQVESKFADEDVDESMKQEYVDLDEIFRNEYTETSEETTETTAETSETQETTETAAEETTTTVKETEAAAKPKVIGTLEIKRLDIDVLVVEGVAEKDLKVGVGHFPGTAGIGDYGNCAIAGHRSYTFGKFFNRLGEIEVGDEILVSDGYKTFKYIVYKVHIVEPEDTYVLNQVEGYRILTLVTCEPIYVATHRLIVHARIAD